MSNNFLFSVKNNKWFIVWNVCICIISIYSHSLHAQTSGADIANFEELLAAHRGESVYNNACAACHGRSGDGNGPAARYLDPKPRDFTQGTYKFRSTESGQLPTDADLYRTVTRGIPRTSMPSWQNLLAEKQRKDVVAYIKTFSDKFKKYGAGKPVKIGNPPRMTRKSLIEGLSVYMLMECWACHGVKGKGDGKSAKTLKDDWGVKIKPFDFTVGNYKGGNRPADIYKTFHTGMNGTPMPSFADAFIYGSDSIEDFNSYMPAYSAREISILKSYLQSQPKQENIFNLSETEMSKLISQRSWSLVHYVKSLSKKTSWFYKLFKEDTEVTK